MKTRFLSQLCLVLLLAGVSASAFGRDFADDVIEYFDSVMQVWKSQRLENALIKSPKDMAVYASLHEPSFPLNKLAPDDKKRFLDNLQFNEKGLTSFYYEPLLTLEPADRYKLLSLFGFERLNPTINNSRSDNKSCIFGNQHNKCNDYIGYKCVGKGTCQSSAGFICTSNC